MKAVNIEANTALLMAKTHDPSGRAAVPEGIGESHRRRQGRRRVDPARAWKSLGTLVIDDQRAAARRSPPWRRPQGHHGDGDAFAHAKHMHEHVLPAMLEIRKAADKLETIVADDLWPLPTYREMLFIK